MRLLLIDENDKIVVQYDHKQVKELLIKYYEIHKDIGKSFDLLSGDLLEKARTK